MSKVGDFCLDFPLLSWSKQDNGQRVTDVIERFGRQIQAEEELISELVHEVLSVKIGVNVLESEKDSTDKAGVLWWSVFSNTDANGDSDNKLKFVAPSVLDSKVQMESSTDELEEGERYQISSLVSYLVQDQPIRLLSRGDDLIKGERKL